jgi:tetraacyldisaccharide-1-P 4'-kinase
MPRQTLLFDENRYYWLKPRLNFHEGSDKGGDLNREKSVVILYDNGYRRINLHHVVCHGCNAIVPDDFIHHPAINHNLWILWSHSPDNREKGARLPPAPIRKPETKKRTILFARSLK